MIKLIQRKGELPLTTKGKALQQKLGLGRGRSNKRKERTGAEQRDAQQEPEDANRGLRPHQVGLARPDEDPIEQPQSAEEGLVPKIPFRLYLSGSTGSGKTNVARWMLDKHYKKPDGRPWFDEYYLLSPTADIDPAWEDLEGLKKENRITKPSARHLKRILEESLKDVKERGRKQAKKRLTIVDDSIAESIIRSRAYLRFNIRSRHGLNSLMVMSQSYIKNPRSSRIQSSHIIMFPSQVSEVERLHDEYGPPQMSKDEFYAMVGAATRPTEQEKFPFFYLNRTAPFEERYRRNLDIVLNPHDYMEGGAEETETGQGENALSFLEPDHQTPTKSRRRNKRQRVDRNMSNKESSLY